MIREYLKANGNFGMRIEISHEEELLDTGGGLKRAAWFFLEGDSQEPFVVHNVDVISTIDLARMVQFHLAKGALATLAVLERETKRYLLFDEKSTLCGRRTGRDGEPELVRTVHATQALAFCGVHILSPKIFEKLAEEGAFPIINAYLRLAARGEKIAAFRADEYRWRDLGRPESVLLAARELEEGVYSAS
jgi:NDP-sugar pyrophosphorylase family protein